MLSFVFINKGFSEKPASLPLTAGPSVDLESNVTVIGEEMTCMTKENCCVVTSPKAKRVQAEQYEKKEKTVLTANKFQIKWIEMGEQRQIRSLEAFGDVVIHKEKMVIHADKCLYDHAKSKVYCWGNVRVQEEKNTLEGDEGEIDLKTSIYKVKGMHSHKAKAVFFTKNSQKNLKKPILGNFNASKAQSK
jgi:lipopolysaccharide export system protein LptA